jgi:hypothetical protein
MGFPYREAMRVLSTQCPEPTKPIREHGPTPYRSVAVLANQNFIQPYR